MSFWKEFPKYVGWKLATLSIGNGILFMLLSHIIMSHSIMADFSDVDTYVNGIFYSFVLHVIREFIEVLALRFCKSEIVNITTRVKKDMWLKISTDDPSHLDKCDISLNTAITEGTEAVTGVIEQWFHTMVYAGGVVAYITLMGAKSYHVGFWLIILIIATVIAGSLVVRKVHKMRSENNKKSNPLNNFLRYLAENFMFDMLNGDSSKTMNKILTLSEEKNVASYKMDLYIAIHHKVIFFVYKLLAICVIVLNKHHFNSAVELAIMVRVSVDLGNYSWGLFNIFNTVSNASSKWASFDKFVEGHHELPKGRRLLSGVSQIKNKLFGNTKVPNHMRIDGVKGSGKTTWMKSAVMYMHRTYKPGQCIYVHQKVDVAVSKYLTVREYITNGDKKIRDAIIQRWSVNLGIDNKINAQTLDKPFDGLSGGECKIVNILRYFLPILCGNVKKTRVVFGDEITANLDRESQMRVRTLLKRVTEMGVLVIEADHNPSDIYSIHISKLKKI
jgi:ABC-type transport system involved in cytochrome bd biosynthesis fused ATPase/permease subunit